MHDYNEGEVPYVVIERSGSGFGPFIWGAVLGAAAALLLAPKSGSETQRELKDRARRLRDRAEAKVGELQENLEDAVSEGRRQFQDKVASARRSLEERRERVERAVDAGREAAREARAEMESELAEARRSEEGSDEATTA